MELSITLPDGSQRVALAGPGERNLKIIRESLGVQLSARNGDLRIVGESHAVHRAVEIIQQLAAAARQQQAVSRQQLLEMVTASGQKTDAHTEAAIAGGSVASNLTADFIDVYLTGRTIRPLTGGQRQYLDAIFKHDLTLCVGPAGTGKTYLAVAAAVAMLKRGMVRRLALVRPAVEAGEKLGFLPGDMQDKVDPYLRPLNDALHDMMEFEQIQKFMASDVIEIIPLAFMRGRTLNDTVIILDEAQNTTAGQMLMFLTRLGHGSKMIVTGDTTQIDLEDPRQSGLIDACRRLRPVRGVAMVALEQTDIVRHNLVQRIVAAYGTNDRRHAPWQREDDPAANQHPDE